LDLLFFAEKKIQCLSQEPYLLKPISSLSSPLRHGKSRGAIFQGSQKVNENDVAHLKGLYDQEIRYVDDEIGLSPGRGSDGLCWPFGFCAAAPWCAGAIQRPSTLPTSGREARGGGLPRSGRHTPAVDSLLQGAGAGYGERGPSATVVSSSRPS